MMAGCQPAPQHARKPLSAGSEDRGSGTSMQKWTKNLDKLACVPFASGPLYYYWNIK